jgi:DNA-binding HxlR family transcriptional regulator
MSEGFSPELKQFIAQHVESLAQLETLLLMRQDPQRHWDCAELSRLLYITPDMCGGLVKELEQRGIVVRVTESAAHYRYQPANADFDRLLGELAAIYQDRRVAVITQIYSRPQKKIQTFADAFRLRREGPT